MREAPGRRFTAREIAEVLIRRYPEWAEKKRHASKDIFTENDLVAYLRGEINSGKNLLVKKYPSAHTIEDRPRQYYWSEPPTSFSPLTPSGREKKAEGARSLREADRYPLLGRYLHRELELWPKRIDEKATSKKGSGFNRWLFPDLVAMELTIGANWPAAVIACAHEMQASRARMWSFEVKLELDRSNAREAFFQAVSNSSWANFGYLVTARIQGDGTLDELRVLGALHGIGLIRLDTKNPSENEILVPARERPEVDWASLARLAEASTDVWKFVQAVITSVSAKKPIKEDFDYRGD